MSPDGLSLSPVWCAPQPSPAIRSQLNQLIHFDEKCISWAFHSMSKSLLICDWLENVLGDSEEETEDRAVWPQFSERTHSGGADGGVEPEISSALFAFTGCQVPSGRQWSKWLRTKVLDSAYLGWLEYCFYSQVGGLCKVTTVNFHFLISKGDTHHALLIVVMRIK